jgi:hypothetical protein
MSEILPTWAGYITLHLCGTLSYFAALLVSRAGVRLPAKAPRVLFTEVVLVVRTIVGKTHHCLVYQESVLERKQRNTYGVM